MNTYKFKVHFDNEYGTVALIVEVHAYNYYAAENFVSALHPTAFLVEAV